MTNDMIYNTLLNATENAFKSLFETHECFYYCSLILPDDGFPFISASSVEKYQEIILKQRKNNSDHAFEVLDYKWSYADSPYCRYGYQSWFSETEKIFSETLRSVTSQKQHDEIIQMWLLIMTDVMKHLIKKGLFGSRKQRDNVFISVELVPPDKSNLIRAKQLNTKKSFETWYSEFYNDNNDLLRLEQYYYSVRHPQLCDILLIKTVTDKKQLYQIKKDLGLTIGINDLCEKSKDVPFVLANAYDYTKALEFMTIYPEYINIIQIKKH